jgi:Uma2 family endonuclease
MASATTQIPSQPAAVRPEGLDQRVEFRGVGWGGYSRLLELRGEKAVPRIILLDETVYLMAPSQQHERLRIRMGTFFTELFLGLRIPFKPTGQMTLRCDERRVGVEGDETYYIKNEPGVRGMKPDLAVDPPPDLAVEVVNAHPADTALEVYRRLRVPEVWLAEDGKISFLILGTDGYASSETSQALPFLTADEVGRMIHLPGDEGELAWGLALRRWVEVELAPRVRKG